MRRQNLIAAGALLGAGLALTACDVRLGAIGVNDQQAVQSYDVTDKITGLTVDSGSGDVVINESDRTGVHVTETLHWHGDKPQNGHQVDGGALTLGYRCGNCSIDYRIEIPRGLAVRADAGSGTITLRGLTGETSAGTGSGDIDARGLAGRRVTAQTGSGDVELRFSAVPDDVDVETGSGDGTVWVPYGSYNVKTETGVGSKDVTVAQDPSAPHTVVVKTGSGDAKVLKN
ncbi:lipoprotein [Planotetraspora thailandica]|uniref:Lipoprotein n=1 Tax=Planotetraspora thailandica TaxID=487172 RepID=A0A8J3XU42_9ACTN|nr:DUF4097 family beta strand repeat-containing protein [Planotetraspora thailandica]GII55027.1 lipoprotein [Planotetraspora thailandica]